MNREEQLKRDIAGLDAVTAEIITAAGDLLKGGELSPSNARAREEVIELLGVNYVGPEIFNKLFESTSSSGWFKKAIKFLNPFKDRVIPVPFEEPQLDFVKLKEILNEADEWEMGKRKFQTYALVFKPPISFLELRHRANEAATANGKTRVFFVGETDSWYITEAFATQVPETGHWELVRRETVPCSTSKILSDQKALIADKPNLAPSSFPALAALSLGQYLAHDIKLYDGEYHFGRTSACAASGAAIVLGSLTPRGGAIVIAHALAGGDVGLAVSRKLECFSEVFAGMKWRQSF